MPLFTIIGRDGPQGLERRKIHREAHLAGLREQVAAGRIAHAGPLLDEAGQPVGSLIVLEAPDLAAARAQAAHDPYVTEGVFSHYEVFETRAVFGDRAGAHDA